MAKINIDKETKNLQELLEQVHREINDTIASNIKKKKQTRLFRSSLKPEGYDEALKPFTQAGKESEFHLEEHKADLSNNQKALAILTNACEDPKIEKLLSAKSNLEKALETIHASPDDSNINIDALNQVKKNANRLSGNFSTLRARLVSDNDLKTQPSDSDIFEKYLDKINSQINSLNKIIKAASITGNTARKEICEAQIKRLNNCQQNLQAHSGKKEFNPTFYDFSDTNKAIKQAQDVINSDNVVTRGFRAVARGLGNFGNAVRSIFTANKQSLAIDYQAPEANTQSKDIQTEDLDTQKSAETKPTEAIDKKAELEELEKLQQQLYSEINDQLAKEIKKEKQSRFFRASIKPDGYDDAIKPFTTAGNQNEFVLGNHMQALRANNNESALKIVEKASKAPAIKKLLDAKNNLEKCIKSLESAPDGVNLNKEAVNQIKKTTNRLSGTLSTFRSALVTERNLNLAASTANKDVFKNYINKIDAQITDLNLIIDAARESGNTAREKVCQQQINRLSASKANLQIYLDKNDFNPAFYNFSEANNAIKQANDVIKSENVVTRGLRTVARGFNNLGNAIRSVFTTDSRKKPADANTLEVAAVQATVPSSTVSPPSSPAQSSTRENMPKRARKNHTRPKPAEELQEPVPTLPAASTPAPAAPAASTSAPASNAASTPAPSAASSAAPSVASTPVSQAASQAASVPASPAASATEPTAPAPASAAASQPNQETQAVKRPISNARTAGATQAQVATENASAPEKIDIDIDTQDVKFKHTVQKVNSSYALPTDAEINAIRNVKGEPGIIRAHCAIEITNKIGGKIKLLGNAEQCKQIVRDWAIKELVQNLSDTVDLTSSVQGLEEEFNNAKPSKPDERASITPSK